jgi:phage terminase small subunit
MFVKYFIPIYTAYISKIYLKCDYMGIHFDTLPIKYQKFVAEYIKSGNLSQAAREAGSTARNISQAGSQIYRRADVQLAIAELTAKVTERLEISVERVLLELARIGFSDLRRVFDDEGRLIDITKLDEDTAAAISSIEVVTQARGEKVEYVHKIKTFDKRGPLDSLGKHLGIFGADNDQRKYTESSLEELLEERRRIAAKFDSVQ